MPYSGAGAGTPADPYQIVTLAQLQETGSYLTSSFLLMNDIDASATESDIITYPDGFDPIGGGVATPFTGTFDGDNYTIRNLYINKPATNTVGLFGVFDPATTGNTIKDFTLENINYTGLETIGGVFGALRSQSGKVINVSNVSVSGTIVAKGDVGATIDGGQPATAGGFTSYASGTVNITNCSASVEITHSTDATGSIYLGGLIGSARALTVTLTSCSASGNLTCSSNMASGDCIMGGFGANDAGGPTCTKCSATGNVTCTAIGTVTYYIGGFWGLNNSGVTCTKCFSYGDVTLSPISGTPTTAYAGGFIASIVSNQSLCGSDSKVENLATAGVAAGGFAGATTGGTIANCYANGSVCKDGLNLATGSIGGFVGIHGGTVINTSYSTGEVYTPATNGGGFCGTRSIDDNPDGVSCFWDTETSGWSTSNKDEWSKTVASNHPTTSVVCSGTTATVTLASHGYVVGNVVKVTGCTPTGFNGTWVVATRPGTGSFTYTLPDATLNGQTSSTEATLYKKVAYGRTTTQMQTASTFTGAVSPWNFTTIWDIAAFTRSPGNPTTVWLSHTSDYENFEGGVKDADSFSLTVPTGNSILWLEGVEALVVGTSGDEWIIGSNKLGTPLTPSNFSVKKQSSFGSANIQPLKVNETVLFVDYVSRKIRELVFNDSAQKYTAPDLTSLAEHITLGGITNLAYQRNPDSIVWAVVNGELRSMCYDREQNVVAWAKHPIDGTVMSVCVIPGTTEDEVWLSIGRTIGAVGSTSDYTYIERMKPRNFGTSATSIKDAFFVDCGITTASADVVKVITNVSIGTTVTVTSAAHGFYNGDVVAIAGIVGTVGTSLLNGNSYTVGSRADDTFVLVGANSTGLAYTSDGTATIHCISGLTHLAGETVSVLGTVSGVTTVYEDLVVSLSGRVKLTGTATATTAQVGLPYTSKLQPTTLVFNTQGGTSQLQTKRIPKLSLSLLNTANIKYGDSTSELYDVNLSTPDLTNSSDITGLFTGSVDVTMSGGFSSDAPIIISTDAPLPATVRAIIADITKTG